MLNINFNLYNPKFILWEFTVLLAVDTALPKWCSIS